MVELKSFDEVLKNLKDRKKWEVNSQEKFDKAICKGCKRVLSNVGRSSLVGVCSSCVHDAMNPSDEEPKGL